MSESYLGNTPLAKHQQSVLPDLPVLVVEWQKGYEEGHDNQGRCFNQTGLLLQSQVRFDSVELVSGTVPLPPTLIQQQSRQHNGGKCGVFLRIAALFLPKFRSELHIKVGGIWFG